MFIRKNRKREESKGNITEKERDGKEKSGASHSLNYYRERFV